LNPNQRSRLRKALASAGLLGRALSVDSDRQIGAESRRRAGPAARDRYRGELVVPAATGA
jgi:hypothetical protein